MHTCLYRTHEFLYYTNAFFLICHVYLFFHAHFFFIPHYTYFFCLPLYAYYFCSLFYACYFLLHVFVSYFLLIISAIYFMLMMPFRVHLSPLNTIKSEKYKKWMSSFSPLTIHIGIIQKFMSAI